MGYISRLRRARKIVKASIDEGRDGLAEKVAAQSQKLVPVGSTGGTKASMRMSVRRGYKKIHYGAVERDRGGRPYVWFVEARSKFLKKALQRTRRNIRVAARRAQKRMQRGAA